MHYIALRVAPGSETLAGFKGDAALNAHALPRSGFVQDLLCGAPHNIEVGAAWAKRSNEGRSYLSVKLDDPSFTNPIYANLVEDESGKTHTLIWSRPNGRRGG